MRLWGYYAIHTFWNTLRKIFRSTFVIVMVCCVIFGVIVGLSAAVIGSTFFPDSDTEISDSSQQETDYAGTDQFVETDGKLSADAIHKIKLGAEAGSAVLLIIFLLFGIYSGAKKGSDIFLMADVNFLFTAPKKPQTVLMFRLSFQMIGLLFGSLYLLFQLPNLIVNLHLSAYAALAIILAWLILIVLQKLMSVLTYTVTSTHPAIKRYVLHFVLTVAAVFLLIIGALYLTGGRDIWRTLEYLGDNPTRYIPVIGWYKAMLLNAVDGNITAFFVYLGLLLVSMVLMIWGIWHIKADFYEDAMTGASVREEMRTAALEGRKTNAKERSEKIHRNGELKGYGASVFLHKELYNRKRFCRLGFISNTMLFYLAVAVLIPLFSLKVLDVQCKFLVIGIVLIIILFLRNYGNPIAAETAGNWLFLVPDSAYKKVFYAMMAGSAACALDLLPAMILGCVLTKENPLLVLLWYVTLLLLDFMLSAIGMFLQAVFPASAMDVVKTMLQFMLKIFALILSVILLAVGYLIGGIAVGLLFVNLCDLALGIAGFVLYPEMLHRGIY